MTRFTFFINLSSRNKLQMKKIQSFVKQNFRPLFYILLFGFVVVGSITSNNSEILRNKLSPKGIISLELNASQNKQKDILLTWQKASKQTWYFSIDPASRHKIVNGIEVAREQTFWDFILIFCYTLMLPLLLIRVYRGRIKFLRIGLMLIIIAGVLDCLENIGIFLALKNFDSPCQYIYLPSYGKWIIILLILAWLLYFVIRYHAAELLRNISSFISNAFTLLVQFRIIVISILLIFFALWFSDQGRDLLLVINNNWIGPVIFLTMISVLALLNWLLPKYYSTLNYTSLRSGNMSLTKIFLGQQAPLQPNQKGDLYTARLLGCVTFLVPAVCILNALRTFHIPYILDEVNPIFLGLFTVIFYHMALQHQWIDKLFAKNESSKMGFAKKIIFSIAFVLIIVLLIGILGKAHATYYLAWLSFDLFLLSFAFLIFTTLRRFATGTFFDLPAITRLLMIAALVISILFLALNFYPNPLSKFLRIVALPVLFCAICFYTLLFTYLLFVGRKYRISIITLLFITCFLIASLKRNDFHKVDLIASQKRPVDSLNVYAAKWINSRLPEIDSFNKNYGEPSPVFLVNAYGGGIRAAAWTAITVSYLDSIAIAKGSKNDFQHFVFSYSGASGGTIGASVLCATRFKYNSEGKRNLNPAEWLLWFKNDFLTPVLIGLLGRDIWFSSFSIPWFHDRAYLQEFTWEDHLHKELSVNYDGEFYSYWYPSINDPYQVPLLFSNTYDIDGGLKGIVAPVKLSPLNFPGSVFVNNLIDNNHYLKLSSAAFLSSRFPFISPTGKVDDYHHFMDGGFKENSGAETSREILMVLDSIIKTNPSFKDKIQLQLLSLPNSVNESDTLEKAKNVSELTAPLTALMNNWIGNTKKADSVNYIDTSSYHYNYFSLRPEQLPVDSFQPALPLGWQISDYGLKEMLLSLHNERDTIDKILKKIVPR